MRSFFYSLLVVLVLIYCVVCQENARLESDRDGGGNTQQYPFVVAVGNDDGSEIVCHGTLIDEHTVLTSTFCARKQETSLVTLDALEAFESTLQKRRIVQRVLQPIPASRSDSLALLRVDGSVDEVTKVAYFAEEISIGMKLMVTASEYGTTRLYESTLVELGNCMKDDENEGIASLLCIESNLPCGNNGGGIFEERTGNVVGVLPESECSETRTHFLAINVGSQGNVNWINRRKTDLELDALVDDVPMVIAFDDGTGPAEINDMFPAMETELDYEEYLDGLL